VQFVEYNGILQVAVLERVHDGLILTQK